MDPAVASQISKNCVQGILKTKTRILITHQYQFLTDADNLHADYILYLNVNKVKNKSQGDALLSIVLKSLNFRTSQLRSKRLCRTPLLLVVGDKVGWPFLIMYKDSELIYSFCSSTGSRFELGSAHNSNRSSTLHKFIKYMACRIPRFLTFKKV